MVLIQLWGNSRFKELWRADDWRFSHTSRMLGWDTGTWIRGGSYDQLWKADWTGEGDLSGCRSEKWASCLIGRRFPTFSNTRAYKWRLNYGLERNKSFWAGNYPNGSRNLRWQFRWRCEASKRPGAGRTGKQLLQGSRGSGHEHEFGNDRNEGR